MNVTGSEISGNSAGAIWNGGMLNVTNSTISRNGAVDSTSSPGQIFGGGGILNTGSNATANVTNSTITGNSVFGISVGGGGIANNGGTVNVKSSIIALNSSPSSGPDVYGAFTSQGFNLIGKKDGSTGFTLATDKKGTIASPLNAKFDLKGLRNNGGLTQTIALQASSPAVDKGSSLGLTGTLTTDQRGAGFPRKVDRAVANATGGDGTDIGAFELGL